MSFFAPSTRTLFLTALLTLVACDAAPDSPQASPSATPSAPIVGGPADGLRESLIPSSLVPTLPIPTECVWEPDAALAKQLDPEGLKSLTAITSHDENFVIVGDEATHHESQDQWTTRPAPSHLTAIAVHKGKLITVGDATVRRFNGSKWIKDKVPSGTTYLASVATPSSDSPIAWTVGFRSTNAGDRVAVWRYRGSKWLNVAAPKLGSGHTQRLNGVVAVSNGMVGVGVAEVGGKGSPLVLRHDGTKWRTASLKAPKGASWTELQAITAVGETLIAVGDFQDKQGLHAVAYTSSDNGASWTQVKVPQPGLSGTRGFAPPYGPTLLGIVSNQTGDVFAVGEHIAEHPRGEMELLEVAFVVRLEDGEFVQEKVSAKTNEQDPILLYGVGISGDEVMAVGLYGNGAYVLRRNCS